MHSYYNVVARRDMIIFKSDQTYLSEFESQVGLKSDAFHIRTCVDSIMSHMGNVRIRNKNNEWGYWDLRKKKQSTFSRFPTMIWFKENPKKLFVTLLVPLSWQNLVQSWSLIISDVVSVYLTELEWRTLGEQLQYIKHSSESSQECLFPLLKIFSYTGYVLSNRNNKLLGFLEWFLKIFS